MTLKITWISVFRGFPRSTLIYTGGSDSREKIRDRGIADSWKHYLELGDAVFVHSPVHSGWDVHG